MMPLPQKRVVQTSRPAPNASARVANPPNRSMPPMRSVPAQPALPPVQSKPVITQSSRSAQPNPTVTQSSRPIQPNPPVTQSSHSAQSKPAPPQPAKPAYPKPVITQSLRPIQPKPAPAMQPSPKPKPAYGCVEQLNPAPLSDRIKQFEATTNPVLPTPPPAATASSGQDVQGRVEVLHPPPMSERKALFEKTMGGAQTNPVPMRTSQPVVEARVTQERSAQPHKLVIPPPAEGQLSLSEMLEKRTLSQVNTSSQPHKLTIPPPAEGQLSLSEMLEKRTLSQVNTSSQPHKLVIPPPAEGQLSLSEMLEKRTQNQVNPSQPHKLTIPPPAEGQVSLSEMLEKRAVMQSSTITMKETRQVSVTQRHNSIPPAPPKGAESPRSPQVLVENDSVEIVPEQETTPLFTANGVFLAELRKEEVKLAFSSEDPLPFTGYTNVVLCVYADQICFYLFDAVNSRYDFIVQSLCLPTE